MTDINESSKSATRGGSGPARSGTEAAGSDADLADIVELLFFAYRDFTSDPDTLLAEIGFGRAHHRVLHFIDRHPGLRVADLLDILKITKQSLARVLKQLVDKGYVAQEAGQVDRRERLLYPTQKGRALAARLEAPQCARIASALHRAGPGGAEIVKAFLEAMVNRTDRQHVRQLIAAPRGKGDVR